MAEKMIAQDKDKELLALTDTQNEKKKKNKKKKKRKFKVAYLTIGGLILGTIGSVLGAGTPILVALFSAGLMGALGGTMTGFIVKAIIKTGSGAKKLVTKLFGKEEKENVDEEEKEEEAEETKENVFDKAKNLWQSIKDKVEQANLARQEKKEAKLEEQKKKEEAQEDDYEEDYEEDQDLEDKPSLKERLFSKFHRKEKKNSSKVKSILKLDDDEELEEGKDEQLDSSNQDEHKDLEATPKKPQEDNPLFTHRLKRSELRRPKYVIFEEIYKQPSETITTSTGRLSVNTEQFLKDAKKQLDVLNEQLVRTQNEILQLEKQIGDIYNAPTKKMAR